MVFEGVHTHTHLVVQLLTFSFHTIFTIFKVLVRPRIKHFSYSDHTHLALQYRLHTCCGIGDPKKKVIKTMLA